jgi:glycosyltransferase involved in cell wall biosynthesis
MGVETTELEALGQDRSYSPGTLHLVTVARLHPGKGILHALAAVHRGIQKGLDLSYTVAGEGPHRGAIEARIKELDLSSRVTLTGTLSEIEVYQLLSKSDALLLPSTGLGEAWPVAVMEAMGAGLPVIASSIGATPEMIVSGEDGLLVPKGDEDALLNSIIILANDIDARQRLGEAARKTARLRFDVGITAAALRDAIYNG